MISDEPVWGAPQPHRWSSRHTLTAIGVAAVIAVLGGAAIYATNGESNAIGPGMHGPPGPRPVHGEFVVPNGTGGYHTELTQTGVITAISGVSITARSADGFTQTYALDSGVANPQVAVNDTVTIHGRLISGTATAMTVAEEDQG